MAIPKRIHYCWFGGNPLPKLAKKCIKSWKKYCKDYEIIEWNENNFDINQAPLYVRQAYRAKKWAFVTDYVRLYAMVTYGGVYMDTDVELVKKIDSYLYHQAFSGFENETSIPTGIMASEKVFPLFVELLKYYDNATFIKEDGSFNLTTNVTIITNACLERGFQPNNALQNIDGFVVYPKDYFCPINAETGELVKTKNTTAIHHFAASWHSKEQKKRKDAYWKEMKILRSKARWNRFVHFPHRLLLKILGENRYNRFRMKFHKKK